MDFPLADSWIEQLAGFDEALRLGRDPARAEALDPQLAQTQQFLRLMQSVWPRAAQRIGPYMVVRNLGQGAIGPSYLVEDPDTRQPLVLKILWPDLSAHAETRVQFVRDAKSAQQPRHTGIAALREVRDSGPLCSVVSEYCEGESLAGWRRRRPQPIAWDVAGVLIVKLADILAAAHRPGITHGSLKPSNIFLAHEKEITPSNLGQAALKVSDFGLAKAVQQTCLPLQGGLAWRMPQCLAPEQLQHRTLGPTAASDLYALGVIWYDLLTGRCPVKGATREELVAHAYETVPPPRQYRPEVPTEVETLVLQCLERQPSARPASAQALADALRRLLPEDDSGSARPAWWKRWLGWR